MKKSKEHPFEYNVLLLACILGLVRSLLAVIDDLDDLSQHPDFPTDIMFTLIFIFSIVALRKFSSSKWLLFLFYTPFVLLLVYTFFKSNGLLRSIEHNIFAGLVFIIFTLKGRLSIYFTVILIAGVVASTIILELEYGFFENFHNEHTSDLNFIFASLGIIGITYYAKHVLVQGRNQLSENRDELEMKTRDLESKRDELEDQQKALEKLAVELSKMVSQRASALKSQKERREKYLALTSNELTLHYEKTIKNIENLKAERDGEPLLDMLFESGNSLKKEIGALKTKIDQP